jgi:radical SAM superfamily enzyme with C-terminal helix-hairpin-helix motif
MTHVTLVDGYIDEPGSLGVPPYIHPLVRAAYGAARDAGAEVSYHTIDDLREGWHPERTDVSIVLTGSAVPGRYIRASPASKRELERYLPTIGGVKILGGPLTLEMEVGRSALFDIIAIKDPASCLFDYLMGKDPTNRWRTVDEWNRWLMMGAEVVKKHRDFPQPLVAEIETYRGCIRYMSGGCSFCVEPLKGAPVCREPKDIVDECRELHRLGVRNFRLGAQTCFISYHAHLDGTETPRPDPEAIEDLLSGIAELGVDLLHLDNANPAVIAAHPEESEQVLRSIVRHCTSGNVLALGMESADPIVVKENNLNATAGQVMQAIELINSIGRERGQSGLPSVLPGLNFIIGLNGETKRTLELNYDFLEDVLRKDLLLRRINIRQVIGIRREFKGGVSHSDFLKFKQKVRENIDGPMLEKVAPLGTVLRRVYTEMREGKTTFGRQIGTYPLLVGFSYPIELDRFVDAIVSGHGFRSLTAVEHPLLINKCSLAAIASLPAVGKKRAANILVHRPYKNKEEFIASMDDQTVGKAIAEMLDFSI